MAVFYVNFVAFLRIIHLLEVPKREIHISLIEGVLSMGIPALISAKGIAVLLSWGMRTVVPNFNISSFLITTFIACVVCEDVTVKR